MEDGDTAQRDDDGARRMDVPPLPPPFELPQGANRLSESTPTKGVPAISPHLPGIPAFSSEDVEDYVRAHPHKYWDRSTPQPTIKAVLFLTSAEVDQTSQAKFGLPNDSLLCVVLEMGRFTKRSPFGAPITGSFAYRIYHAETGNHLRLGFSRFPYRFTKGD